MFTQIGLVGYGVFGRLLADKLKHYCSLKVYDKQPISISESNLQTASIDEVLAQPVIILAIPVQAQESFWQANAHKVNPHSLVMDVSSVKLIPIRWMRQYLPPSTQIVGLHPLFGPHTVAKVGGWSGLTIVSCPVRVKKKTYSQLKDFLETKLELTVTELNPKAHDQRMAWVQALTFFIGKGIANLNIQASSLDTLTYKYLLNIKEVVTSDTEDLFYTIQKYNPYARAIRKKFLQTLKQLDQQIVKFKPE
jgi:prephenate dehydrogenase